MLLTRRAWTALGIAAALVAGVAIGRGGCGGDATVPVEPTAAPPAAPANPASPSAPGAAQTDAPPVPGLGAPPARLEVPRNPPEPDTPEEIALRERLRTTRTGFKFEGGLDLATVLTYLAARHEVKIVVDANAVADCAKAHPHLAVNDTPLADALDLLVGFAPGVKWEVEGSSVQVRRAQVRRP